MSTALSRMPTGAAMMSRFHTSRPPSLATGTDDPVKALWRPEELGAQGGGGSPTVGLMFARRGRGKTLTLTVLSKIMKARYAKSQKRLSIYTNYWNEIADFADPFILDAVTDPRYMGQVKDGLMCIDEIQSFASSRRSMSRYSVGLSQYLTQLRKQRLDVLLTTQFPQVVDYQLLIQVDYFIECDLQPDNRSCMLYVHDYWGQVTGNFWRKTWPPPFWEADWTLELLNVNTVFGLYDRYVYIPPTYQDQEQRFAQVINEWAVKGHTGKLIRRFDDDYSGVEAGIVIPTASVPQNADDVLAQWIGRTTPFNIRRPLTEAQIFEPSMTAGELAGVLEQHNYRIVKKGGQTFAEPKAEATLIPA